MALSSKNAPRAPSRGLSAVLSSLRARWIPESEVRAEAWALGGRHAGRVLEGARSELKGPNLSFRRSILLRAVIRSRRRDRAA
jgi:hypothetical protein